MQVSQVLTTVRFNDFSPQSRVWVYQANRDLTENEISQIRSAIQQFAKGWQVHGSPAKAEADLLYNRFVVFVVDDTTPASGCSIDTSVKFMQQLEQRFKLNFFNRLQICYIKEENNKISAAPMNRLKEAFREGELPSSTLIFNNTVSTLAELQENWLIPASESFLIPE